LTGRVLFPSSIERWWMTQQQRDIKWKLVLLRRARDLGNVALTARRLEISRQGRRLILRNSLSGGP